MVSLNAALPPPRRFPRGRVARRARAELRAAPHKPLQLRGDPRSSARSLALSRITLKISAQPRTRRTAPRFLPPDSPLAVPGAVLPGSVPGSPLGPAARGPRPRAAGRGPARRCCCGTGSAHRNPGCSAPHRGPEPTQGCLHRAQRGSRTPGQAQGTSSQAASHHRDPTPSWGLPRPQAWHSKVWHGMAWPWHSMARPLHGAAQYSTAQPVAFACHGTGRQGVPGAQPGSASYEQAAAAASNPAHGQRGLDSARGTVPDSTSGWPPEPCRQERTGKGEFSGGVWEGCCGIVIPCEILLSEFQVTFYRY